MQTISKCFAGAFKRLKYFHGMLLKEDDFQNEQTYFREKNKLHNRLHGYGVVWGLELIKTTGTDVKVTIKPGLALDCFGNEIIVCKNFVLDLQQKITDMEDQGKIHSETECSSPPSQPPKIYVGIKFCECKSDPVPQYASECSTDDLTTQFSRIKEGFSWKLFAEDELPPSPRNTPTPTPDCLNGPNDEYCAGVNPCNIENHFIILGSIKIEQSLSDEADYSILDDHIDNYDRRQLVFTPSLWSNLQWEQMKQKFLQEFCKQKGWVDISPVIGKSFERAKCILENFNFQSGKIKQLTTSAFESDINKIVQLTNSIPWVSNSQDIDIYLITVTNNANSVVLCAITAPA